MLPFIDSRRLAITCLPYDRLFARECESQLPRINSISQKLMRLRIESERQNNIPPFREFQYLNFQLTLEYLKLKVIGKRSTFWGSLRAPAGRVAWELINRDGRDAQD
jgi:hypothetical protein